MKCSCWTIGRTFLSKLIKNQKNTVAIQKEHKLIIENLLIRTVKILDLQVRSSWKNTSNVSNWSKRRMLTLLPTISEFPNKKSKIPKAIIYKESSRLIILDSKNTRQRAIRLKKKSIRLSSNPSPTSMVILLNLSHRKCS
jgi:hypothetical protein